MFDFCVAVTDAYVSLLTVRVAKFTRQIFLTLGSVRESSKVQLLRSVCVYEAI